MVEFDIHAEHKAQNFDNTQAEMHDLPSLWTGSQLWLRGGVRFQIHQTYWNSG